MFLSNSVDMMKNLGALPCYGGLSLPGRARRAGGSPGYILLVILIFQKKELFGFKDGLGNVEANLGMHWGPF